MLNVNVQMKRVVLTSLPAVTASASSSVGSVTAMTTAATAAMNSNVPHRLVNRTLTSLARTDIASQRGGIAMETSIVLMAAMKR